MHEVEGLEVLHARGDLCGHVDKASVTVERGGEGVSGRIEAGERVSGSGEAKGVVVIIERPILTW